MITSTTENSTSIVKVEGLNYGCMGLAITVTQVVFSKASQILRKPLAMTPANPA
jgi:hypothetical protein